MKVGLGVGVGARAELGNTTDDNDVGKELSNAEAAELTL